jgi:transcription antitermination factor NusG
MRTSKEEAPWVALQVRAKTEQTVVKHLTYRGYECLLPLSRANADQRAAGKALFPAYVFCRFDASTCAPIITTPGVIRVVSVDGKVAQIRNEEIDAVRRAVESGQCVTASDSFQPGCYVHIEGGPLRGISGHVIEANKKQYLVVSIRLVQRSIVWSSTRDGFVSSSNHIPPLVDASHRWPRRWSREPPRIVTARERSEQSRACNRKPPVLHHVAKASPAGWASVASPYEKAAWPVEWRQKKARGRRCSTMRTSELVNRA